MDSDDDFFVVKRKLPDKAPTKPIKHRSSPSSGRKKRGSQTSTSDPAADSTQSRKKRRAADISAFGSSSDPDIDVSFATKTPAKRKAAVARPLTPPPETDAAVLANVDRIVRENLRYLGGNHPYATVEIAEEDDDTYTDMDPALAAIRVEAACRAEGRQTGNGSTKSTSAYNQRGLAMYERPHTLELGDNETFERIFEVMTDRSGVGSVSQLVLTYQDRRIFRYSTPASLGLYGRAALRGYSKPDYRAVLESAERQRAKDEQEKTAKSAAYADTAQSPERGYKRLTLRGPAGRQLVLSVHSNASFRSLLASYLEEYKQMDQSANASLAFDGESIDLSQAVADLEDLEDEDVIDVVLL